MKHRRDVGQLADSLKTCAAQILGPLVHQAGTGCRLSGTSGKNHDDIVGNKLFHQLDMAVIRTDSGIVAAHHGHRAADYTGGNALNQRLRGSGHIHLAVGHAVQHLHDSFRGESHSGFLLHLGNINQILISVHKVFHSRTHDPLRVFPCSLRIKPDEIGIRHLGDWGGGDEFGVEAFGQRAQGRKNTLYIHHNGLTCSGQHHILLLQEVSGHGNAPPHGYFVGSTADTGHIDAVGSQRFRQGDHLRILRVFTDHLGKAGIMAVYDNIDHILFHNAQVRLRVHRLRSSKHDIGKFRSAHGTAPSVGHTGTERLTHQRLRLAGISHVGHVHGSGNLPVNGPGLDFRVMPQFLCMLRRSLQPPLHAEGFSVLQQGQLRHLMSKIINILTFRLHAPLFGNPDQLLRIFHLVISVRRHRVQGMADLPSVIGMGGCSARYKTQEITARDSVGVAAADSSGRLGGDPAGPHGTDPAANSLLAELTVGRLILYTQLPGIRPHLFPGLQQTFGSRLKFFHTCQSEFTHVILLFCTSCDFVYIITICQGISHQRFIDRCQQFIERTNNGEHASRTFHCHE